MSLVTSQVMRGAWTVIPDLTEPKQLQLSTAAIFPSRLIEDWPQVRELLIESAHAIGVAPITGPTPVLSAPIVRLLCLILAAHGRGGTISSGHSPTDRIEVSDRELKNLREAAAGTSKGPLTDWPVLGGLLYRIADELSVGGRPDVGHFQSTSVSEPALRMLCLLLLEHVDVDPER